MKATVRAAWLFVVSLVRDPHDGSFSPVAGGSIVAMIVLSKGFLSEVATRSVSWSDFVGYACAMTIASGAPIADRVLGVVGSRLSASGGGS